MTDTEAERAAQEWRKNHCGEQYKAERRGIWTGGCPSVLVKDAYLAGWAAARDRMRCKNCQYWKRGIAEFSCETKPDFGCVLFEAKE